MKKALTYVSLCALCMAAFGVQPKAKEEEKLIKLSPVEWDAVKKCVDTNGYCRIVGQGAAIVITNGLPEVEHLFPLVEDRLDRNPLRLEGRRGKKEPYRPGPEPMPYIGQGGWR